MKDIQIKARDGFSLGATWRDAGESRVVVINSATAVPRQFYRHIAEYLVSAGYSVVTYDYRGIGGSRPRSLRGFPAKMRDWALQDMAGIIDWVCQERRPDRVFMVSHSVGGQVAGLLDNSDAIDGMVTLSSQSGHWRLQGGDQKAAVAFHTHVTLPAMSRAFGYMPWSKLGSAEDLPKHVALEWARWCRCRNYLLDDRTLPLERYAKFRAPVLAYSFGDDKWGTSEAVDAMMGAYPVLERRHVEPKEVGMRRIGHFGYFRPDAASMWTELTDWLGER
ncbi:MAG: alpha/beta fold hydrolase [Myxococcota bacterium]